MSVSNGAQRAPRRSLSRPVISSITLLALLVLRSTLADPMMVAASLSAPTLKLVATVSGGSAAPSAWTLNAGNNTTSFSGPGPAVGPSSIAAGVAYAIFETGGPASGYTASGWVCSDPTGAPVSLSGQRITLQAGQNADVRCHQHVPRRDARTARPRRPVATPDARTGGNAAPPGSGGNAHAGSGRGRHRRPGDGRRDGSERCLGRAHLVREYAFPTARRSSSRPAGSTGWTPPSSSPTATTSPSRGTARRCAANGGTTEASSLFWLGSYGGGNSGIVIRNFTLVGNSTTPGVYQSGREGAHGILVDSGSAIEITGVTVRGVWGDCLYVGSAASGVSFHDSTCASNGRNGVTITSGTNVTVQRVAFPMSGYCTFDIEPNVSTESASNIQFLDNTAGKWTNSFLSAEGAVGSTVSGLTISGNSVTGGSLLTIIGLSRRQNVVFTNNRSTIAACGPRPALRPHRWPDGHRQRPAPLLGSPREHHRQHRGHLHPLNPGQRPFERRAGCTMQALDLWRRARNRSMRSTKTGMCTMRWF